VLKNQNGASLDTAIGIAICRTR